MLCGFGNKRKNLGYFLNLRMWTLRYFPIFGGLRFIGSRSKWLFRRDPYCPFSSDMVSFPPLPTFGATSPPLKILSSGSLFSFACRNSKSQQGQPSSGSRSLGCGAVAPMPLQINWTQRYFSRRLRRTLCTWSIFHLGTKGVSFS